VDSTPADDAEFTPTSATQGVGRGAAAGGVDLLTVVMHELSHELGADDLNPSVVPDSLMTETLGAGVRRLPNGGTWALSVERGPAYLWLDEAEKPARMEASVGPPSQTWSPVWQGTEPQAALAVVAGEAERGPELAPDWFPLEFLGGVAVG
jgi:hypothetical protein